MVARVAVTFALPDPRDGRASLLVALAALARGEGKKAVVPVVGTAAEWAAVGRVHVTVHAPSAQAALAGADLEALADRLVAVAVARGSRWGQATV